MASTTFSGPIRTGKEENNTLAYCNMSHRSTVSVAFNTTTGTALGIKIPANSTILGAQLLVDVLFANSSTTSITLGTTTAANELTAAAAVSATTTAVVLYPKITSGANSWSTVGTADVDVYVKVVTNSASAGSGHIVIEYAQNSNPYTANNGVN
tara:strand:+ start:929 stop:1390 length:462 start_codon:yes stop_codon:yes gene_type:complete